LQPRIGGKERTIPKEPRRWNQDNVPGFWLLGWEVGNSERKFPELVLSELPVTRSALFRPTIKSGYLPAIQSSEGFRPYVGVITITRRGLPLPPTILSGAAITMAPRGGS